MSCEVDNEFSFSQPTRSEKWNSPQDCCASQCAKAAAHNCLRLWLSTPRQKAKRGEGLCQLILPCGRSSQRKGRAGTQDENPEAGTVSGAAEECGSRADYLLRSLLSWPLTTSRDGTPTVGGPRMSITDQDSTPQTCIQNNLTEVFSRLRRCQVDKIQPSFADLTNSEMTVEITVTAQVTYWQRGTCAHPSWAFGGTALLCSTEDIHQPGTVVWILNVPPWPAR